MHQSYPFTPISPFTPEKDQKKTSPTGQRGPKRKLRNSPTLLDAPENDREIHGEDVEENGRDSERERNTSTIGKLAYFSALFTLQTILFVVSYRSTNTGLGSRRIECLVLRINENPEYKFIQFAVTSEGAEKKQHRETSHSDESQKTSGSKLESSKNGERKEEGGRKREGGNPATGNLN
ncbi:hypothetical protein WH47_03659 [Habropoda laboriosa]|uniref:Uncharacterized protein n=1 Tax=Habropoda laboriosa TaxID=597456 RepID=A0A0L7RIL2_9HYME|nr:hypothetical protein WH47_03659 [Habropoda laboriosa]